MDESRIRSGRPISRMPSSSSGTASSASRPITQQGLSGVRPVQTSRSGTSRMYKDKRYYMSLMQSRMNSIREELTRLRKTTADYRTISLNRLETRKSAEASARHYAECQEVLSIHNIVLDIQTSQDKSEKLAYETSLLKERNKHALNELDILISYKERREEKIVLLRKSIVEEDQALQNLIERFSNEDKVKYIEAINRNHKLVDQIKEIQYEIDYHKDSLKQYQKNLSQNQVKQEYVYLLQNLDRAKTQREGLLIQLQETLTPTKQREILVRQVKDNKADTDALINVKNSLEAELQNKNEKLLELEAELNEKNSARLKKHKELRDRDEHMSKFIATFGEKSPVIREKIDALQKQILLVLEHFVNTVADINFEELDNIQSNLNQSSLESLSVQFLLHSSRLARLKSFKQKYCGELESLKQNQTTMQKEIQSLRNPETTRDELTAKFAQTSDKRGALQHSLATTTAAINEIERRQAEIEMQLYNNKLYHQTLELEKSLENLENNNQEMQATLNTALLSEQVSRSLKQIEEIAADRNEKLVSALRNKKKSKTAEGELGSFLNDAPWQDDSKLLRPEIATLSAHAEEVSTLSLWEK